MSESKKQLLTLGACAALAAFTGSAMQALLTAALTAERTVLAYILYYLATVFSTLWLFVGAAAVGRLVYAGRGGAMAAGAGLFLCAVLCAELLPLAVSAADNVAVDFITLLRYNLSSVLAECGWYAARLAIALAVFLAARARRKPLDGAFLAVAVAVALLPAVVELVGTTVPFLLSASRNQLAAEGLKLLLEYLLYFVFGALGLASGWLYLRFCERKKVDG